MKVAICLGDVIDNNVSENHCVSKSSLTKTVSNCNLFQYILTLIVGQLSSFIANIGSGHHLASANVQVNLFFMAARWGAAGLGLLDFGIGPTMN